MAKNTTEQRKSKLGMHKASSQKQKEEQDHTPQSNRIKGTGKINTTPFD